ELLALGQRDLDLRAAVLEINPQRHDRVAALAHSPAQTIDLAAMEQQLAGTGLLMAELAGGRVCADMDSMQKDLAVLHARVAVAEIDLVRAQRLDLRADQGESRLVDIFYKEVVAG